MMLYFNYSANPSVFSWFQLDSNTYMNIYLHLLLNLSTLFLIEGKFNSSPHSAKLKNIVHA